MPFRSERGSEKYTQVLSTLKKDIAKIYDQTIRRLLVACRIHLEVRCYTCTILVVARGSCLKYCIVTTL